MALDSIEGLAMGEELLDEVLGAAELELADADDGAPEGDHEVRAYRVALGELLRAEPSMVGHLEQVMRRLQSIGVGAALRTIVSEPLLLQALRLTLEIFVRRHPSPKAYSVRRELEEQASPVSSDELWEGHQKLLAALRDTLS